MTPLPPLFQIFQSSLDLAQDPPSPLFLSPEEALYFKELQDPQRRKVFLQGHHLLHQKLLEVFQISNPPLQRTPQGQWVHPEGLIFFSISHSQSQILLGFSKKPMGVDIQHATPIPQKPAFQNKVFHPNEIRFLEGQPSLPHTSLFSLKEAHGKALGTGLTKSREMDLSAYLPALFQEGLYEDSRIFLSSKLENDFHISVAVLKE